MRSSEQVQKFFKSCVEFKNKYKTILKKENEKWGREIYGLKNWVQLKWNEMGKWRIKICQLQLDFELNENERFNDNEH